MNQQSFKLALLPPAEDGVPRVKAGTNGGPFAQTDLGIVMHHFEVAAQDQVFRWV